MKTLQECECVRGYDKELVFSKRQFRNVNELVRYLRLNKKAAECQKPCESRRGEYENGEESEMRKVYPGFASA